MKLVLLDFDGTLTTHDTLIQFIRFYVGDLRYLLGLFVLSPTLLAYKLKILSNQKTKEKVIKYFFGGTKENDFKNAAKKYSLNHIDSIMRPKALDKIKWHKDNGHKLVIVSASIECWLKPWCDKHNIELIATKLEIKNNTITGNLYTKNCYGEEKIKRINQQYTLKKFDYIYAYGNSRGDKEMLEIAAESYYKPFR